MTWVSLHNSTTGHLISVRQHIMRDAVDVRASLGGGGVNAQGFKWRSSDDVNAGAQQVPCAPCALSKGER